jgi:heme-degrading monooxygenase HmoA
MTEMPVQLEEMDAKVTYAEQLQQDTGPVVLINKFNVAPADVERFLETWADDAAFMKQQPGYIATQLHRGSAGSTTFINIAVWESAKALGAAFRSPEFQARAATPTAPSPRPTSLRRSPSPGICVD